MLERLGPQRLAVSLAGDGGGSLVEAVAAASDDGTRTMALWNLTLDQSKAAGSAPLDRDVVVEVSGLEPGAAYTLRHERIDQGHSNVAGVWGRLKEDGQDWPTDEQWAQLREADRLEELEPLRQVAASEDGVVRIETTLPMPSMSLLTLRPTS